MSSAWNHSVCERCFGKLKPGQEPTALKEEFRIHEICCFCGNLHDSGIYIRYDPQLCLCKGDHEDD